MRGILFLIHWNPPEAEHLARDLRSANWRVDIETENPARARRRINERPPDAVVISLARAPIDGVETAFALRSNKGTNVPIVFLDGKEDTIKSAKARVPAAIFTTSGALQETLAPYAKASWG